MALFLLPNGPMQTAAAMPPVTTGTSIKTLLQFKASATLQAEVVEWGISFDGSAAATPGKVELIETDGAATVTGFVAADITKLDAAAIACGDPTTNLIQIGSTASGYTSSGEGSITVTRDLDAPQLIAPTNQFIKQFPLGCRPIVQVAKFLRIRVTFAAAINAYCYVVINV